MKRPGLAPLLLLLLLLPLEVLLLSLLLCGGRIPLTLPIPTTT